ncbi:TonB-dependent receptor [Microbulbifer elongatus]|uniref:TonB-dependent receptor n=1 Tax=Microbulbifer elongatus TaxID=86173 RepID=A0ABT1NWL2_9GAMM|nr:TonB-dependent receptor [Microbulbifer elongatus]MCQ3828279.1 TonB-dependent receptor [Microbulbifer elongatus]
MLKRNKLALSISAAVLSGGLMAPMAVAQDALEEITVTGIRGALQDAMNIKRDATGMVDAVSAEDIGKFPDTNVAEALGRIPGVTVSRQFGEGDAVSIRGASNQLTLTTLNGQNVASTGWYSQQAIDRSFNYSMLPPELISGIEVHKSSRADLLEGGVGGTVNVKTRKPLDLDANSVFLSGSGTYGTSSEEVDPSYSGLYSFKNDSETFGVMIAAAVSDYSLTRRGQEGLPSWGGRVAPTVFQQTRERTAFDATLQFAPTDEIEFGLHHMNLELAADNVNASIWIPQDLSNCEENAQGIPVKCESSNGSAGQTFWDVRPRLGTMKSETTDAWFTYETDTLKFDAVIGNTEATGGTDFETNVAYLNTTSSTDGVIDATGDELGYGFDPSMDLADLPTAGNYAGWEGLQTGAVISQPNSDEEQYFQADLAFNVNAGPVHSFKTGIRYSSHAVEQTQLRGIFDGYDGAAEANIHDASEFVDGNNTVDAGGIYFPAPNGDAMVAYTNSLLTGWGEDRSSYVDIEEDNLAAYAMVEFESGAISGDAGIRYISTDASSSYYAPQPGFVDPNNAFNNGYSTSLAKDEADYHDFLPSLNLKMELSEEVDLRLSAAQVIARPNYNDMFANSALLGYSDNIPGNEQVVKGNVALKPYKAAQADFGVNWYYGDDDMLGVAYFVKDVSNFTTFGNTPDQSIGLVSPDTGEDSWLVQGLVDGTGGTIDGIEFQMQHAFDNGFGTVVNYTWADSEADASNFEDGNNVFSDSSEHTVNLVGYYENDMFSARAAYNWRSEYMIREIGFYSNREHQDFGTLDLSFVWYAMENLDVTFDVVNLLEEDSIQVGRDQGDSATFWRTSNGYPAYSYEGEARFKAGVNYRF